jgi:RNA polymerase sigma-70 factor (ECF subfamily)
MGFLLKMGVRFEDAQDAVAETMKRFCEKWESIDSPRAWGRATAYHFAVDVVRRERVERSKLQRFLPFAPGEVAGADDLHMLQEEQRAVISQIRELPAKQRVVLALHLDGFTSLEIARMLGSRSGTVSSNLRHAKQRLRVALIAEGVYAPPGPARHNTGDE